MAEVEAAARETREEAGLTGRLGRRICEVSEAKTRTVMFAMYVEVEMERWDEAGERANKHLHARL